ncbi:uncharacterized protein LOC123526377 [Mercenaria mercenaria]|uniref:uncharacterized protein LOC123526377 n=1 Tax=Mercenaria mercenaria TaxID=6596 RepID=UPI00234EE4C0|nr:uncharacterized protein LOC123526377 [Mercenaria mercenaria]XP_045161443.2 uncharacterized protein LOC123526377 [Mercenaria mercenaria]XP_045161444.2 uncharacterized protein LOC123526377 [Mercenaria mercenaria]
MATSNFSDNDNWILAAFGLTYLKEGLEEFIDYTLGQQHNEFLKVLSPQTGQCYQCSINTILPFHATSKSVCKRRNCICRDKKRILCPNGQCSQIHDLIVSDHRKKDPNWTNTDPRKWFTSHISIGTCFINTHGYLHLRAINEIDCLGLLSIIINNTYFERVVGPSFVLQDIIKARDARNDIFHDPNLQLVDSKMQYFISLFMKVLAIPQIKTTSAAKTALAKLTLIRDGQHPYSNHGELEKVKLENKALGEIIEAKAVALKSVEKRVFKVEQQIEENDHMSETNTSEHGGVFQSYDRWRKKKKLRRDLICFYRSKYSTLSISPLFQTNNAPLLKFYATPTLYQIESKLRRDWDTEKNTDRAERIIEKGNRVQLNGKRRQPIALTNVFFRDSNNLNNVIYLTSDAGYGKTSFAKRLIMSWCQAHDTLKTDRHFYNNIEISVMAKFDFLFFIPLKEYREMEHNVDRMIYRQLDTCLRRPFPYSFVTYVLNNKKCLIILDGIDEWIPPSISNFKHTFDIPHSKFRETCSVLATTRLWKFSNIDIESEHLHVELSGLEDKEAIKLIENAVSFLNDKYGRRKNHTHFYRDIKMHRLHDIKNVPLLLMQTICLWFDGKSLGNSRCEIYFNLVELLLRKCEGRPTEIKVTKEDIETTLPAWFSENEFCCKYYAYISALGKLSFHTLFGTNQGSSLVFSQTVTKKYIEEKELQFGLNVGLLSKDKVLGKLASGHYNISFIHKTYQELLSALYITSQYRDPENVYRMINCYCSTIENVLEMSKVFIFLSGLNPNMFEDVAVNFTQFVVRDETQTSDKTLSALYEYQTMVLNCYKEIHANNEKKFDFRLCDIILDEHICQADLKLLQEKSDKKGILSLRLKAGKACPVKQQIVKEVLEKSIDLQQLQLQIQNTLKLGFPVTWLEMSNDSLNSHKQVQLIYLSGISLFNLDLSSCLELRSLHIAESQIKTLDISHCVKIQNLHLEKIPITHVTLPCSSLHELHLKYLNISEIDLACCVNLLYLHIGELTISKLDLQPCSKLKELRLECIKNISQLHLSPCTQLQQVHIQNIGLSTVDLSTCKYLKQLHLEDMAVSELQLSCCKELQQLHLNDLALTKIDLKYCQKLQKLHLQRLWRISEICIDRCLHLQQMILHGLEIKRLDLSICEKTEILQLREISITQLDLSACVSLKQFLVEDLVITDLNMRCCTQLQRLEVHRLAIEQLNLSFCQQLKQLHLKYLWRLLSINLTYCTQLQHLHVQSLTKVHQLQLSPCEQLRILHVEEISIAKLDLSPCLQLQQLRLQELEIPRVTLVPCERIHIQSLNKLSNIDMSLCGNLQTLHLQSLQKLTQLDLSPCRYLKQLHLEEMEILQFNLSKCHQLENLFLNRLPVTTLDMSSCELLLCLRLYHVKVAYLDLSYCTQLTEIDLKELVVKELNFSRCEQLNQLELQHLRRLSQLVLSHCTKLQSVRLVCVPVPRPDLSHCTLLDENNVDIKQ